MTNVSEFLYQLYAKAMVLLVYFLIELVLIVQYLRSETQRTITTTQYLNFIEEKNPTICYTKRRRILQQVEEAEHEGEDEAEECRVCLSELEEGDKLRNLKCKHAFHKDCLDKWLRESCPTCPLCRSKVVPDDVAAKYHLFQNQVVDNHDAGTHNQLILLLYSIRGASILHRYL